jgi:hypothetical protein
MLGYIAFTILASCALFMLLASLRARRRKK